jgi:hypothetical protein
MSDGVIISSIISAGAVIVVAMIKMMPGRGTNGIYDLVKEMHSWTRDLYRWHDKDDQNDRKVWYAPNMDELMANHKRIMTELLEIKKEMMKND